MTTPDRPHMTDYARAARICLCLMDQDIDRFNRIITEINTEGTGNLLIATFAELLYSNMRQPAKTIAEIRAAWEGVVALEQLESGHDG
ncbi:hypothetical protein QN239_20315 [Mycolicibacterium sp. Y3]